MKPKGISLLVLALFFTSARSANADLIYSLAGDWSDTANPNSAWSYNGGANPIAVHQPNWDPGNISGWLAPQPAWAYSTIPLPGHIPAWFQSVGNVHFDMPVGRVFVHAYDPFNGFPGASPANVTWTSPINGTVTISGDVWLARKSEGRSEHWDLLVNGVPVTGGDLSSSDPFTSSNPFPFSNGSGGPAALMQQVSVGDVITFQTVRIGDQPGEFVGIDLTISAQPIPVPEPSTLALLGLGFLGLAGYGWRRRKRLARNWCQL